MKYLISFFILFIFVTQDIYAITPSLHKVLDTEPYKLIQVNSKFFLKIEGQKPDISIPSEWLLNKKPINSRLEKYITLNKFEKK